MQTPTKELNLVYRNPQDYVNLEDPHYQFNVLQKLSLNNQYLY